jgi:protein farnesyltransferase/geranylgeranyltransferase type-1 subunit alpha
VIYPANLRRRQPSRYVKQNLSLAPNNLSAWNYLRGVLDVNQTPYSRLLEFVKPYAVAASDGPIADLVDLENPPPARGVSLPCPAAIELLADIYEKEGGEDQILQATEVCSVFADRLNC